VRWRRAIDHLLTTFPFEAALFAGSGIPSSFVGHPLFEAPLAPPRTPEAWPESGGVEIELLPGSRRQELRSHAPVVLEAAAAIEETLPVEYFTIRLARPEHRARFEEGAVAARRRPAAWSYAYGHDECEDVGPRPPLLGAVACSGTVTAELAASLVPMCVYYRMSPFLRLGTFLGLTAPYVALANLCAGTRVVPERVQVSARGDRVAQDFLRVSGDPVAWKTCRDALDRRVRQRIAVADVADRAARAMLSAAAPLLQDPPDRSARPVGASATSSNPAGGPS